MSLTEVPKQLNKRWLHCDCVAWFPWVHETARFDGQALGLGRMAIFYIGGAVHVSLQWGLADLDRLTAAADHVTAVANVSPHLDVFKGVHCPGQHWSHYRSEHEGAPSKSLRQRLVDLFIPSTNDLFLRVKQNLWT